MLFPHRASRSRVDVRHQGTGDVIYGKHITSHHITSRQVSQEMVRVVGIDVDEGIFYPLWDIQRSCVNVQSKVAVNSS